MRVILCTVLYLLKAVWTVESLLYCLWRKCATNDYSCYSTRSPLTCSTAQASITRSRGVLHTKPSKIFGKKRTIHVPHLQRGIFGYKHIFGLKLGCVVRRKKNDCYVYSHSQLNCWAQPSNSACFVYGCSNRSLMQRFFIGKKKIKNTGDGFYDY